MATLRPTRPGTLVWIDGREAILVRANGDEVRLERMTSDVPAHHRSTGHVRFQPTVRHGGGGRPQTAGEPHRLEHLKRFVERVALHVNPNDDLLLLGSGTVREHLARSIRAMDARHDGERSVTCEAAPPLTEGQLEARLRHFVGKDAVRRTAGPYRQRDRVVT